MIETHPFGNFFPKDSRYLILGSFATREFYLNKTDVVYDWFYGTKRNQFWPILREIYGLKLETRKEKEDLFKKLGIAIADIIYQCERAKASNLDSHLINIVYNEKPIARLLKTRKIKKIYFSSRYVEMRFRKLFKLLIPHINLKLITLPSPSPRYAVMSKEEKIQKYKAALPRLS